MMIISSILLILAIFPNFLNIGKFFYRIFGFNVIIVYLFMFLVGLATFRRLSFTATKKYMLYIFMSYFSILCLLHLIFSTEVLKNLYVEFSHMGSYISNTYKLTHGYSVGGALLSILVFLIRGICGVAGSYVVYVVLSAIFIGLAVDYVIYNRSIEKRKDAFSQKNKAKLEEKLNHKPTSFENEEDSLNNMPTFSFSQNYNGDSLNQTNSNLFDDDFGNDFKSEKAFETTFEEEVDLFERVDDNATSRDLAKKKLFGNLDDDNDSNSTNDDTQPERPKTARELLFGEKPKLPDYFYTNPNAEKDTRDFVDSYRRNNNIQSDSFYTDPTPTKTPNLDENILNTRSVRTSWNNFSPETSSDDEDISTRNENLFGNRNRGLDDKDDQSFSRLDQNQRNTTNTQNLFGFSNNDSENNESDISFTSRRSSNFSNIQDLNITKPIFEKPKSEPEQQKPEKKVTKQANIFDDAPKKYYAPPLSLLKTYKDDNRDHSAEHKRKTDILNQVFESFKIPAEVSNVVRGPKFTRYEISLQIGVPVNKILQIEKNIEMALETDSGIRIEAPIPGKNAVGIEVKNDISTTVGLKELLESPEYVNSKHNLPVVIGKNITGNIVVSSMDKMLHALVAGSTGSGKSVFVHSLILSLLYKCSPDELKLVIIDPKQVDFVQYNGIPHLISPEVLFSYDQAINTLTWSVKEMERRYGFLKQAGYSNIKDYNNSPKVKSGEDRKLPFIVIIVDEFSNLMSEDKNGTLELMIKKITEKARAAGIHMVIATQRPSVDVITGVIKNNLPTRIALTLSSGVDSRTILDEVGAEKLLGYGDMLFAPQDSNKKIRLQGAFVSDDEIKSVIKYIKSNNISSFDQSITDEINKKREEDPTEVEVKSSQSSSSTESKADRMDDLMARSLELVMARKKATITMLQTKLSIGYSRAARIISQMEEKGFISNNNDGKPREVYITQEQYDELFGNNSDN